MTKNDLLVIKKWMNNHGNYMFCLSIAAMLLVMASLFAIDTWWDGGSCVNSYNYTDERCNPGGKAIDIPELIVLSVIPTICAIGLMLSLPFNTAVLKLRRMDFDGNKIEPKRIRRLREREQELGLEPWE